MLPQLLATTLGLTLILVPGSVACLAGRRLWMSRSRNALLYWLVGGFAFAGAAGAAQTGLAGQQVDAGGMAVAMASLPLWLLARLAPQRSGPVAEQLRPVFSSVRAGGARSALQSAGPRPTSKA